MNQAQQVFESMAQVDGLIIGLDAGMISDDQLVEFLTNCDEEDFEFIQAELSDQDVTDLGEFFEEDLSRLKSADGLDELKKKVVRGGKVKVITKKRLKASTRRAMSLAAKKAGRMRKGKKLKASTRRKIAKSMGKRTALGL